MTYGLCADILRAMLRFLRVLFKVLATLFGIVALLVMIAAWRIATWAATARDVTPYIQTALSYVAPEVTAQIGQSTLVWDNKKQTLSLACHQVQINDQAGKPVAALESLNLQARVWRLFSGMLVPQVLKAEKAKLWLVRDKDGVISSGLHQGRSEVEKEIHHEIDYLFLQFLADEVSHEKFKHDIHVKDIEVLVRDEKDGQDWSVKIPEVRLFHAKTESKGGMQVQLVEKDRTSSMQASYNFDFDQKLHNVGLSFQGIKPSAFAAQKLGLAELKMLELPFSGTLSLSTDRDLNIAKAQATIEAGQGIIQAPTLWEKPRTVSKAVLEASYDKAKEAFSIPVAQVDFGGPRLGLTLDAKMPPPKDIIWMKNRLESKGFNLTITLDDVPMDHFGEVWPIPVLPDARNWILTSLSKGVFTHGDVTLKGQVRLDDIENLVLESGGGKVYAKGGQVNYLDQMPVVENADAEATFDLEHMDIKITKGNTGPVVIKPFTISINNFQQDIQTIHIPLQLSGPVPHVLKILDAPPLGYAKEMGLSSDDSSGQVEGTLTLDMPLLDALLLKDVGVAAKAKISGFTAKKLVPGIEISNANFDLDLTKDGFDLAGQAGLNAVTSQVKWHTNFGAQSTNKTKPIHDATITATVQGNEWGRFYGLDSLAKVSGPTPVVIKYTNLRKGMSKVGGSVQLRQADLKLKDIGWDKKAGEAAQLDFILDIQNGKNMIFRTIDIKGDGIKVAGTAELDEDSGKLVALKFDPFILGRSNAIISYRKPVDPTQPLSISVEGESFDMNGMEDETPPLNDDLEKPEPQKDKAVSPEEARPKDYTVKLTKMYTSEDGFLASISGHARRDHIGWKEIDLFAVAQGTNPMTMKLSSGLDGKLDFEFKTDNFGTALQGMGFGKGIRGGEIEAWGTSASDNPRAVEGSFKVGSFVVSDLPVLARLLSAVSPFGFMDLITGDASFDKMRGNYRWLGDRIEFKQVRAAGSVVGINLDGRINAQTGQAALSGTLVPFSFVNSIIGSIPLLGDVITGGSGQGVIAASFSVKGQLSDPSVSVNPVSLLTPGFLRNIFFSGDEEKGEGEKPKKGSTPKTEAQPQPAVGNFNKQPDTKKQ